jgi:hypothetical protein
MHVSILAQLATDRWLYAGRKIVKQDPVSGCDEA